jgi:hypothetical protein
MTTDVARVTANCDLRIDRLLSCFGVFVCLATAVAFAAPVASAQSYTIDVQFAGPGTVTPSGLVEVPAGGSRTFTFTPSGCNVGVVTVDDVPVGVGLTEYTFTNVQADHILNVQFGPRSTTTTIDVRPAVGQCAMPETLTATVVNGEDGGEVQFFVFDGGGVVASSTLASGTATAIFTSGLATGSYTLSASYLGTSCSAPSSSPGVAYDVADTGPTPVTLTLSLPNTAPLHAMVVATTTLWIGGVADARNGQVAYYDGTTALGTVAMSSGHSSIQFEVNATTNVHVITAVAHVSLCAGNVASEPETLFVVPPLFSPPFLSYGTGQGAYSVAIADLNADGRPDLAVASGSGVSVLLGYGDGTFGAHTDFGQGSESVAIADLNGDGRPDLAVAGGAMSVLLGNGDGTFGPSSDVGTGGNSVAIADLNADGKPDLAVADWFGLRASVLLGNGDGTFQPQTYYPISGGYASSVAIADLNGDGRPDLVVTYVYGRYEGGEVAVFLGNADGTFGAHTDFALAGGRPTSVAIADLNADGRLDLATADAGHFFSGYTVSVLLGNGDGTFGPASAFVTGPAPQSVAIADLNADGLPDLAVAGGGVSVLPGNGDGTFQPRTDFTTGALYPASMAIADLNADRRPDMVTTNGGASVLVLLHTPYQPTAVTLGSISSTTSAIDLLAPNPARAASQIQYSVARAGHVRLEVADVAGRVVTTLFDGVQQPGRFQMAWDGTNRGERLPAGLYFVRLTTLDRTVARKITRLP